jgi:hypothetical protein
VGEGERVRHRLRHPSPRRAPPTNASAQLPGVSNEAMKCNFGFEHLVRLVMDHELMLEIDVIHELSRFR